MLACMKMSKLIKIDTDLKKKGKHRLNRNTGFVFHIKVKIWYDLEGKTKLYEAIFSIVKEHTKIQITVCHSNADTVVYMHIYSQIVIFKEILCYKLGSIGHPISNQTLEIWFGICVLQNLYTYV